MGSSRRARKTQKKAKAPVVVEEVAEEEELTLGRPRKTWSSFENECLVRAWMERSEDHVTGNYQDIEAFLKKVYSTFINLFGKDKNYRCFKTVGAHFRDINKKIQLYNAIYNRIKGSDWNSGQNDADIQSKALVDYVVHYDGKTGLNLMNCWDLVKEHSKWKAIPTKALARRYLQGNRSSKTVQDKLLIKSKHPVRRA